MVYARQQEGYKTKLLDWQQLCFPMGYAHQQEGYKPNGWLENLCFPMVDARQQAVCKAKWLSQKQMVPMVYVPPTNISYIVITFRLRAGRWF